MSETTIKGIEQGRATYAYECAKQAKGRWRKETSKENEDSKKAKEYKSYAKKIPMMVKTNGLGSTLAFVKSKCKQGEDTAYSLLYEQLKTWLSKPENSYYKISLSVGDDLVEKVIALNSSEYRAVTVETLALFGWLRRFAEGLIQGEAEDNG